MNGGAGRPAGRPVAMNGRALAAEVATLTAEALWVFGGVAFLVAALGEGVSPSLGAAAAVVFLSYGLVRLLQQLDLGEETLRLWGAGLSIALLYLILRVDLVGEPYLWELGWLRDLVSEPGRTLEGHSGIVIAAALLGAAWARGVLRGTRPLSFDDVLAGVGLGLLVVLVAAALGPAAGAPGALRWLPLLYLMAGLTALALAHLRSVEVDTRRSFLRAWTLWMGGALGAIGGIALLASFLDPPSLAAVGDALRLAGRGVGVALVFVLSPFIYGLGWAMERLVGWLVTDSEPFVPEVADNSLPEEEGDEEGEPARWTRVLGYVVRSGAVVLVIAVALVILWFVFRRYTRRSEDETDVREEVAHEAGGGLGLLSLFSGALDRLRGRGGGLRGRDDLGRLYLSVLSRAEDQGLPRAPSTTPLEFAPRLDEHFGSPLPGTISRTYVEARYGRRPPRPEEVDSLRFSWEELGRRPPAAPT